MPVRIRNGAISSFTAWTTAELVAQPFRVETVRHRQPGAVVGQDQVAVTEVSGRLGHLRDGAPPVRPVRVRMAVPPELVEERLGRRVEGDGRWLGLELGQVGGDLPGQRLGDGQRGRLAHAGNALETPAGGQLGQLRLGHRFEGAGGVAKGPDLVGVGTVALQEVGDPAQGGDGVHG